MDLSLERDSSSALGSLFQQIINDLKNTSPLWEDFVTKATKLHQCLRAAIQAIAAYLDAFQKIADAATNSRGASKEIGTALTRVCLRHKAVESRLKTFTTAIMDCLVQPLQEKLEDWKRTVITIDKEHAKEYKRCRTELKKRSSDTLRLQKKARKGQSDTIQSLMDSHKQDVTLRRAELEEVEKKSLRSAMIEERLRYCTFVHMLQPVVKEECEVMSELGHLQEAMDSIALVTKEPSVLPQASEELIHDTKATMSLYPESPGGGSSSQGGCSNSLGSRKSSVCSISSMNSSGSSNSPGHHHYPRSLSQLISPAIRLKPGESSDSGFCSSPALTTQASTATSQSHAVSTWPPHSQDAVPVLPPASDRPHTISTAYEKGHQRPPLTVYTFQNPETILEGSGGSGSIPGTPNGTSGGPGSGANTPSTQKSPAGALSRPPLPVRCSSLERPLSANNNRSTNNLLQRQCPSPIPAHITKDKSFEDSIQELNNLIGELDSFQREIDASKRATATTTAVSQATTADGTVGDNCGDRPFPLIGTSSNSVVADNNKMGNNAKAITTLATVVTEAERVDMTTALTVICPPRPPKSPQCASNQTSGCGTDLSDTASDDVAADVGSLTSINNNHNNNNNTKGSNNNEHNASLSSRESCATGHDNNVRTLQQYNSDSELSRCYVSETSSLAGGYENPTFAHFATAVSSSSIAASSGVDEPADVGSVIGDNRSLMAVSSTTTADDCASHTSDTYQMPQQAADNGSDGGSNVVVIYDHQIPMTPDIDYVKQNSEIVVLRTKDPLQQQLGRQEMRELTQLPTSLCAPHDGLATPGAGMMSVLALSSSSLSCLGPNSPPHTATVAPAKQRLSSFRASSEQQLQLLGCGDNNNSGSELSLLRTPHHHHQQYANAGTPQAQTECSKEGSRRVATPPNAHNMHADTIIRRKAAIPPPKPSLSIFNGQAADHLSLEANASVRKSSSSSCRGSCEAVVERLTATPTPPPPLLTKANFKADLDAKIRKQKLKLQLQHEQQQHHELLLQKQQLLQEQQQLQHSPQSAANNTNSSIYLSNHSHNNLNHNNSNNTTINNITTTNTTTNSGVGNGLGNRNSSSGASSNTHNNSNNNNCNAISLNKRSCSTAMSNATTTKTTTASASASASASNHLAFVVKAASSHHHTNASASSSLAGPQLVYQNVSVSTCAYACSSACATPTPPTIHTKQSAASASVSSASASASNSNINSANAKPNITPRPASLSGGVTRIARRSSVNTAKPPPPVRRSSSVTPSHTATGTAATQSPQQNQQQQQQQHQHYQQLHHLHPHANQQLTSATTTTIQNSPYDTVESLPPPPAYLLDSRQAQSSTPTPPPPSAVSATAIPSSSLKVAETVKALSAMRHKPASPNAIRHMQQQQQQQLQQSHQSLQYSPTPTPTPSSPSPTPIQLQQNIYSTTVKTFSSTALLPPDCNTEQTLHYDAYSYYNPYMEVRTTTQLTSAKMPLTNANHANDAKEAAYQTLPITPTPIYYYDAVTMQPTTMATTPTKSKHLQSNALQDTYGVNTALRTTPNKTNNPPVSPSYTSPPPYDFQHSKIELPPPLPPPNPNQQRSLKQQQQKQFVDHQYNTPATCTLQPSQYQHNNNQLQPKRQHEQIYDYLPSHQHLHSPKPQHKPQPQPQQQTSQIQQQQQLAHNIDALMIDNEDEPTVYSDNASFRTSSPGIYAQPKIVTSMSSFRSASPAPTNDHHNQHHHVIPPTQPKTNPNLIAQLSARLSKQNQQQHTGDGIYGSTPNSPNHHNMHQQQLQQQQHQHQHHQSEPVYMRNYTHPHHQQHQPHQQQQMPSVATGSMHQQQNYDAAQTPKHQSSYAHAGGVARQQQQQQQQQHHSHHREPHTHSCPPPLENPPPPPTNSSIYAATANATATMPKNATRSNVSATYAPPTSTMTLPKNLAQQRLQQQQHYQQQQQHYQQQQYQQSIATGANAAAQQHHQAQQHSQTTTVNQRAQMPLPYQQQQQMSYKQKSATLQSNHRQPPIPSRHSSVQQKIFVATNPFIQTTTIHCHSPASVHSQPASPTCSSPSSLASIYGTSSRSHHHHHHQQQQQQQHQHHGSGSGVGGGTAGNGFYAAPHNSTSYASSNIEKAGSIRSKTKAEFLENLNAKLAKQGLSGRAFAVRNLINSKALMYQNPQTLMRPSAQYRAQPQAPPTPPTSSAEESSSH
ncbi:pneumococcal serine-rich repeat protein isoform X14 [Bactrocera oleae]|uniref:pneumococcal serine-rich repeat protein isoform X14 n=1 Tax=Bactrocera oleae TaxID=104688 RepID=UPI00387ED164